MAFQQESGGNVCIYSQYSFNIPRILEVKVCNDYFSKEPKLATKYLVRIRLSEQTRQHIPYFPLYIMPSIPILSTEILCRTLSHTDRNYWQKLDRRWLPAEHLSNANIHIFIYSYMQPYKYDIKTYYCVFIQEVQVRTPLYIQPISGYLSIVHYIGSRHGLSRYCMGCKYTTRSSFGALYWTIREYIDAL